MCDIIKDYEESARECVCQTWCRADYASGFLSAHHGNCGDFNPLHELHVLNRMSMKNLTIAMERGERLEEAEKVIGFYGDGENWYARYEGPYNYTNICPTDRDARKCKGREFSDRGGKRAREYQKKYKGE